MGRAHEVRAASMAKTAAAKSSLFNKWSKEIYVAAKSGVPDPEMNVVLRRTIERAKKCQVTADCIKRAIEKAKGGTGESYQTTLYEGMSKGNSSVIVECLTDNVNRTFASIRSCFTKSGSVLGSSVMFNFKHQAVFSCDNSALSDEDAMEFLLMADCEIDDVTVEDGETVVYAPYTEYNKIRTAFEEGKPEVKLSTDEITYVPQSTITLEGEDLEKFQRLLDLLDEDEDVQHVYHNVNLPEVEEEE